MMPTLPPIRRELYVDADPAIAFRVFTDGIGTWWPIATHGVFGAEATVTFEDDQLVERSADGEPAVWGTVTAWKPGEEVAFTWHPGKDAAKASHVTVSFSPQDGKTLVTLLHDGWESFADPHAARTDYESGWPGVLADFADATRVAA